MPLGLLSRSIPIAATLHSTTRYSAPLVRNFTGTTTNTTFKKYNSKMSISINSKEVPVVLRPGPFKKMGKWDDEHRPQLLKDVLDFQPLKDWAHKFTLDMQKNNNALYVESIEITDADYFGSKKLGFVKYIANTFWNDTQSPVPGIVFARGGAVSVLLLVDVPGEKTDTDPYVFLTVQPRVPIGSCACKELPAGMLDGSSHFVGVTAKEIEEETGVKLEQHKLVDMNDLLSKVQGSKFDGDIYLSGGGCDESMRFFVTRVSIPKEKLDYLLSQETGALNENERIRLEVVRFSELWKSTSDSKAFISLGMYSNLVANGAMPESITNTAL